MCHDILLRSAAGSLELRGCRAKRRDLAPFFCCLPSQILQMYVQARIAVFPRIPRRICDEEREGVRTGIQSRPKMLGHAPTWESLTELILL